MADGPAPGGLLHTYNLAGGGTEDRWCAGEVILVSDGTNIIVPGHVSKKYKKGEAVIMRWDADPARKDEQGHGEEVTESAARLLPSFWNPRGVQKAGGWRFDL